MTSHAGGVPKAPRPPTVSGTENLVLAGLAKTANCELFAGPVVAKLDSLATATDGSRNADGAGDCLATGGKEKVYGALRYFVDVHGSIVHLECDSDKVF